MLSLWRWILWIDFSWQDENFSLSLSLSAGNTNLGFRKQHQAPNTFVCLCPWTVQSPFSKAPLKLKYEKERAVHSPCSMWLWKPIPFSLCIQDTRAPPPVVFADILCTPAAAIFKSVIQYTNHTMCHYTPTSKVCLSVGTEDLSICHSPPFTYN